MFSLGGDPITAVVSIINKLIEVHKVDQWMRFILGIVFSFWFNSAAAMGVALIAHQTFLVALGYGLSAGAGSAWFAFLMNPQAKNIIVAWRQDLEPTSSGYQTTEKSK